MTRALVLAALTFGGCSTMGPDGPPTAPAGGTESADPTGTASQAGESVRIALGATADVAGLSVRFVDVAEDSRCPQNATCVWEGRARVRLAVGGEAAVLTVPHGGPERPDEPQSVAVGGRTVSVTALSPFPGSAEAERGAPVQVEVVVR